MARVSLKKAMTFFRERALPRRTRDSKAEDKQAASASGKGKNAGNAIYRRVGPDEQDRGELYPLCHSGMDTFAHFGVGIGIYFAQLVILTVVTLICGGIMLVAVNDFQKDSYGDGMSKPIPFSAACHARNITATVNCPHGASQCYVVSREHCALPYTSAAADIAMCVVFCVAIFLSKYVEERIEQKLDESVQTAKDYSVVVQDPDDNADDAWQWYEYFSQFGEVKYITILRRNNELTALLLKKHNVVRKIQESGRMSSKSKRSSRLHLDYEILDEEIHKALQKTYPVCKVFVTFDSEHDQHKCLNELEVPDYQAIFDFKSRSIDNRYIFGNNVLDVHEPSEPDNILWQNLTVGGTESRLRNFIAVSAYVGILAVLWYLVKAVRDQVPTLLGLLVGVLDSALPTIFEYLTDFHFPRSEGGKQSSLQIRLFCARFLLSTIIPYLVADWNTMLDPEFIIVVLTVQIAACFTAPLMDLTDWYGFFMRHYYSRWVSDTQEEMNSFWVGSYWSIAEKYTGIAKVLFVSLFYSLLTPIAMLIATVAFVAIFVIHNFLLLRRWKVSSMLDSKIASRLRQQAILSVCAHMFVTMRFIYSWPMDQVYWNGSAYEVVDKQPPYNFFAMTPQPWMSDAQKSIFPRYHVLLILVTIATLHILVLQPFGQWVFEFLCKSIRVSGGPDSLKFSSVESIRIYYPMLRWQEEQYLCSYAKHVLPRHRPVLIESNNIMKDDLSVYVPVEKQKHVLSIVQYFGADPISRYEEDKYIDVDDVLPISAHKTPKLKAKRVFQVSMWERMTQTREQFRATLTQRWQRFVAAMLCRPLTAAQQESAVALTATGGAGAGAGGAASSALSANNRHTVVPTIDEDDEEQAVSPRAGGTGGLGLGGGLTLATGSSDSTTGVSELGRLATLLASPRVAPGNGTGRGSVSGGSSPGGSRNSSVHRTSGGNHSPFADNSGRRASTMSNKARSMATIVLETKRMHDSQQEQLLMASLLNRGNQQQKEQQQQQQQQQQQADPASSTKRRNSSFISPTDAHSLLASTSAAAVTASAAAAAAAAATLEGSFLAEGEDMGMGSSSSGGGGLAGESERSRRLPMTTAAGDVETRLLPSSRNSSKHSSKNSTPTSALVATKLHGPGAGAAGTPTNRGKKDRVSFSFDHVPLATDDDSHDIYTPVPTQTQTHTNSQHLGESGSAESLPSFASSAADSAAASGEGSSNESRADTPT